MFRKIVLFVVLNILSLSASAENIQDIYAQVLKSDPRLLIDSLGVEVGLAREQQAYGALLPQVSFNSVWSENKRKADGRFGVSTDSYSGERYALSVSQPLFDLSKYRAWQRAGVITSQFKLRQQDTQSLVRLDTIERYFQLLGARDELELIREEKESTAKKLAQTKALYQKQLVKITDFYEVDARLDLLVSEEISAMQVVDLAREGLSELTGNPVEYISPLTRSTEYAETVENFDKWTTHLAVKNAALLALQKSIEAAEKKVQQASAGHYPVVALQLSKQKSTIGFENSLSPSTITEVASLNLTVPLYSGGQTSARKYEATQQLALAQATFDQEYRKTIKGLKDTYLGVNAMARRIKAVEKSVGSAEKSYQAMNKSFKLGIATISDVLEAQQIFSEVKRSLQQSKYDYIINKARLLYIAGDLDDDAFYKISSWLM